MTSETAGEPASDELPTLDELACFFDDLGEGLDTDFAFCCCCCSFCCSGTFFRVESPGFTFFEKSGFGFGSDLGVLVWFRVCWLTPVVPFCAVWRSRLGLAFGGAERRILTPPVGVVAPRFASCDWFAIVALDVPFGTPLSVPLVAETAPPVVTGFLGCVGFGRETAPSGSVRAEAFQPSRLDCRLRTFGVTRPDYQSKNKPTHTHAAPISKFFISHPRTFWCGLTRLLPRSPSPLSVISGLALGVASRLMCSVETVRLRSFASPFSEGDASPSGV